MEVNKYNNLLFSWKDTFKNHYKYISHFEALFKIKIIQLVSENKQGCALREMGEIKIFLRK